MLNVRFPKNVAEKFAIYNLGPFLLFRIQIRKSAPESRINGKPTAAMGVFTVSTHCGPMNINPRPISRFSRTAKQRILDLFI